MTEQKCVRTYETNYISYNNNPCSESNCAELNSYLKEGWKIITVTPKERYNEYIIEREIDNSNGVNYGCCNN